MTDPQGVRPGRPTPYRDKIRRTVLLSAEVWEAVERRADERTGVLSDALEDLVRQAADLPRKDTP